MNSFGEFIGKLAGNIGSTKVWIVMMANALIAGLAYLSGDTEVMKVAIYTLGGVDAAYTGVKTYQNTTLAKTNGKTNGQKVETEAKEEVKKEETGKEQVKVSLYQTTPNLDADYKQLQLDFTDSNGVINWFKVAAEVYSWYAERKLNLYHPDAKLPLALKLSDIAIDARRQVFGIVCKIKPPDDYTLSGTESENMVSDMVRKVKGCQVLGTAEDYEINNLGNLYDERRNIQFLTGKSVKWGEGYDTAMKLGELGVQAIG